jgi:hypothetical protein
MNRQAFAGNSVHCDSLHQSKRITAFTAVFERKLPDSILVLHASQFQLEFCDDLIRGVEEISWDRDLTCKVAFSKEVLHNHHLTPP